jgi:hypothetical protein
MCNGNDLISQDMDLWAYQRGVTLDFSRPVKPTDNPFIEALKTARCAANGWGQVGSQYQWNPVRCRLARAMARRRPRALERPRDSLTKAGKIITVTKRVRN